MEVKLPNDSTIAPSCLLLKPQEPEKWIECFNAGEFLELRFIDEIVASTEFEILLHGIHLFETHIDPLLLSLSSFDSAGTLLEHTPGEHIIVIYKGEIYLFIV